MILELAQSSNLLADDICQYLIQNIDDHILLKEVEKRINSSGALNGVDNSKLLIKLIKLKPDPRLDDNFISQVENRKIELPGPTAIKIDPWETFQQEACHDFEPVKPDVYGPVKYNLVPKRDEMNESL